MNRAVTFLLSTLAFTAGTAQADIVSEARLGVMQENICVLDCDNADKEPGQNISAELLFASPDFLDLIWSPKPYVMGSLNTQGDTSFGGFGKAIPRAMLSPRSMSCSARATFSGPRSASTTTSTKPGARS